MATTNGFGVYKPNCSNCANRAKEGYCKEITSHNFGKVVDNNDYCASFKPDYSGVIGDVFGDIFSGKK